MTELLLTI